MADRQRLDQTIRRRDQLRAEAQRIRGRLDSARSELEAVEAECREKGVDPKMLDDAIERLSERYDTVLTGLEVSIQEAEEVLRPFTGEAKE